LNFKFPVETSLQVDRESLAAAEAAVALRRYIFVITLSIALHITLHIPTRGGGGAALLF
jgi:hypothetical protein